MGGFNIPLIDIWIIQTKKQQKLQSLFVAHLTAIEHAVFSANNEAVSKMYHTLSHKENQKIQKEWNNCL